MNRIVLFGAGRIGSTAIKYLGRENVECVIDNDEEKKGKELEGIPIIDFEEFISCEKYRKLELILTVGRKHRDEIERQLATNGINEYFYFSRALFDKMKTLQKRIRNVKKLVVFGWDSDLGARDIGIRWLMDTDTWNKIIGFCDFHDSNRIGKQIEDFVVEPAEKYADIEAVFFVLDSDYAIAADEYLRKMVKNPEQIINPYRKKGYFNGELVVNPYIGKTSEATEETWNSTLDETKITRAVDRYVQIVKDNVPMFRFIEIETYNRCNGVCSFCPVSKNLDPRPEHKMSMDLFKKIINNLAELNYNGELSLFSNNEPFLDDRIIELNAYTRRMLPGARMHLYTNGTLLNIEKFVAIMEYLDELIIDNYRQDLKLIKPVQEIYDYVIQHPEYQGKVTIVLRKPVEILTSRGGDAPNRESIKSFPNNACALPFEQMIIRPDGKVSLCCNDPLGKNTLGDLNKQTLEEVWYGAPYTRVRELISQGRENWEHCKNCDTFYLY